MLADRIAYVREEFESHQNGIETVNRSRVGDVVLSLNRTRMELKPASVILPCFTASRLNRTRMELKHFRPPLDKLREACLNRTRMELKR